MAELPLYWSAPQGRAYVDALNADPEFQKAARKFDGAVVFRCLDTPEGLDVEVTYRIRSGRVTDERREAPAPSREIRDAPFDKKTMFARTTAPYSIWAKLDRGEMSVLQTLTSPDYHLEGPKLKIMANIGMFNAMSAVSSRSPKRYA